MKEQIRQRLLIVLRSPELLHLDSLGATGKAVRVTGASSSCTRVGFGFQGSGFRV